MELIDILYNVDHSLQNKNKMGRQFVKSYCFISISINVQPGI